MRQGAGCAAVGSEAEQQVQGQRTAAVRALGGGDRDWAATKLCLNNRARSRRQANSSGERLGGYR